MPKLRTDDGPRKLRAVWLGPAGHTMPFQWTYVHWLVTLLSGLGGGLAGGALIFSLGAGLVWTLGFGCLWGCAAGVYGSVRIMRHVTYDEPLRYQRDLLRTEFSRRLSSPAQDRLQVFRFSPPAMGYLSQPVLRAMGWDTTEQQPLATETPENPYLTRSES